MAQTNAVTEEFFNCRQTLVSYVMKILKSTGDAEDIVQETYLRLAQNQSKKEILFPRAYLYRVARNVTLDHLRQHKRCNAAHVLLESEAIHTPEAPSPEDCLIADERLNLLREAVLHLPKRCQQVYTLCKVYGMSHREIAEELSISIRTVENHIATAVLLCHRYVVESTSDGKAVVSPDPKQMI